MNRSHYAAALKRHTAAIRSAHLAAADSVAQSARVSDVLEFLRAGDTMGLARHLQPAHIGETLRSVFVAGGTDEAATLPQWAANGGRTVFDPVHPATAEWLVRETARVQAESEARHRAAVQTGVANGHGAGATDLGVSQLVVGFRNPRTGKRHGGAIMQGIDAPALARQFYNAGRKHLHIQALEQGIDAQRALRTYTARRTLQVRDAEARDSIDLRIASALIEHSIYLLRVEAGINAEVQAILTQMERELMAKLAAGSLTTFAEERLAGMLEETKALIATKYEEARQQVDEQELASIETDFTARMLAREIGVKLAQGIVPETVLRSLAGSMLIQGAPSSEWWAQQAADTAFRFSNAVRQGVAQNETVTQMVKRIETTERGTGTVLDTSRRNVAALVRTSVQTVTNEARRATYAQNDDVIEGTRQISTLDSRTSQICIAYSGAAWDLDHKPIAPNKLPWNGGCPRHWGCRSVEAPIVRELVAGLGEFQPSERAAAGGPISAKLSFAQWLESKPVSFQNDLLGEGVAKLWRSGKLTLSELVNAQTGRPLTLAELRAKYAQGD